MSQEFIVSPEEIACACQGALPSLVIEGLELFNQREYFESHEALETAWRAEHGPVRELYRGILQIAVAYLHIERGNYLGAVKMFERSRNWLTPFPDRCRGIDLGSFRQDYHRVEESLHRLGPERVTAFDRGLFHPIYYHPEEKTQ
jgi:predicted metal-dependent hydrolase